VNTKKDTNSVYRLFHIVEIKVKQQQQQSPSTPFQ